MAPTIPPELWERIGRVTADVEQLKRLEVTWSDYRDQLTRLCARLEKRDQRAEKKAPQLEQLEDDVPAEVLNARRLRAHRGN